MIITFLLEKKAAPSMFYKVFYSQEQEIQEFIKHHTISNLSFHVFDLQKKKPTNVLKDRHAICTQAKE